jgi:protein-S-isoprenylcysteine O-methyltransferase Ste14
MAALKPAWLGKLLYGALFTVVLPALLALWAAGTRHLIALPLTIPPAAGLVAAAAGALIMAAGAAALWRHGGGLPMSPFPPPRFVARGLYRFLPHPIYTGFCLACAGVAAALGSASGFWLVTPVVILCAAAFVLGFERHDLRRRFPGATGSRPLADERISAYLFVLLPWLALYEMVVMLGVPRDAVEAWLPFERRLPVVEASEIVYASTYLVTALAPLFARTRDDLRTFMTRGLLSMALVFPLYLTIPLVASPRAFVPEGWMGALLVWERGIDSPAAAFPSYHVIWALISAGIFAARTPRLAWLWRAWAALVAASCVLTGMHAIADVAAAFAVYWAVTRAGAIWERLRRWSEMLANSWKEWRLGPLRVINHGAYTGAGAAVALWIMGGLAGPGHQMALLVAAMAGLVGAGLWAQFIEGSPRLLRPFGYYGGLLGIILGALAAPLVGGSVWTVLAAYGVAGPWLQSMGRLRCLVQGCCHGRPTAQGVGIVYDHPRSRVCSMAGLGGVPVHATPLYSILWNMVVALATARLWTLGAPLQLITGVYLILSGAGRFVEEAYRGEPQTPLVRGLRVYQWLAIGSVIAGALVTALGRAGPAPAAGLAGWSAWLSGVAFGLVVWFALGVDFPASNRRFARLV